MKRSTVFIAIASAGFSVIALLTHIHIENYDVIPLFLDVIVQPLFFGTIVGLFADELMVIKEEQ